MLSGPSVPQFPSWNDGNKIILFSKMLPPQTGADLEEKDPKGTGFLPSEEKKDGKITQN